MEVVDAVTGNGIFSRLRERNPDPKSELNYSNPFTLLVAVTLSAQATDVGVNRVTQQLFAVADTPRKMVELGEDKLRDMIRSLNYFNTKAKHVAELSRQLVERFGGEVPRTLEELESLPGVGHKTASVVANVAFGEPCIAVDTHIFRVANRIPLVHADTPRATQDALEARVPAEFARHAHHWLILLGRYICKARKPECPVCPIDDLCRYPEKTAGA
ncbi:MAG: endonuclease III [Methylobacteriaceae bacterium]|nr:endonuclease III [Methylobacteriaceae bacterium]